MMQRIWAGIVATWAVIAIFALLAFAQRAPAPSASNGGAVVMAHVGGVVMVTPKDPVVTVFPAPYVIVMVTESEYTPAARPVWAAGMQPQKLPCAVNVPVPLKLIVPLMAALPFHCVPQAPSL